MLTLWPALGQGEQVEAGSKTHSKSRDWSFMKVSGSRRVILMTKILEKERNQQGRGWGQHQAETSSVQEAWFQEVRRGWPVAWSLVSPFTWDQLSYRLQDKAIFTAVSCSLNIYARDRHYPTFRLSHSMQMTHELKSPAQTSSESWSPGFRVQLPAGYLLDSLPISQSKHVQKGINQFLGPLSSAYIFLFRAPLSSHINTGLLFEMY